MKIKDLIELLEEENSKAEIIFEFNNAEFIINDLDIESSDNLVVMKLTEV